MFFCCCLTRKPIIIVLIIMSSIGFIWGIIILSRFGSNTGIYKIIKARIDIYESQEKNENKNSNLYFPNFFNLRIKKFRNIDENDDKYDKKMIFMIIMISILKINNLMKIFYN